MRSVKLINIFKNINLLLEVATSIIEVNFSLINDLIINHQFHQFHY